MHARECLGQQKGGSTPLVNADALVARLNVPLTGRRGRSHRVSEARKEGKFVPYSAHNPNYIVDLAAIPVGTKVATTMVAELLARH